jgi:hypothetical protein
MATRARSARRIGVAVVAAACLSGGLAAALAAGSAATASSVAGCSGTYTPNATCEMPYLVPLDESVAYDYAGTHRVCAGAAWSNGAFDGNWQCGTGDAYHCYSGANDLYGYVGSGDPNTYTGWGAEVWNVSTCP